ncbi:hypothetical protein [Burkholderia vietnamiensis]|uniref:hypothetical protein n=1 Tax=Burkholderia vietnamiensis TaxID=60552 RepID=UPI000A431D2A|nr:hypothetical protein [Burkholderia vietnamiensis]
MSKSRKPAVDESNVRYRTLGESWNIEEIRPWIQKKISNPDDAEATKQVGLLTAKTIGAELELAEKMAELFLKDGATMGDYAKLMSERGISAVSLWFCAGFLKGKNVEVLTEQLLRDRQRSASFARYSKDPKQRAKAEVKKLWEMWRRGPSRYPSKAAFARDMLDKFDELKSSKKIEDWVRAWEKEIT